MTGPEADAFSEAILQRVAELAYDELRPHLDAWARRRQAAASTTSTRTTATQADVVDLASHRRTRRAA